MQLLDLALGVLRLNRVTTEHLLRALDQALLPILDLVGMDIELLSELG